MRGFRLKDKLGKGGWELVLPPNERGFVFSRSGCGGVWNDKTATLDQLVAALPADSRETGTFIWSEWLKVGRSIKYIKTDLRYDY